MLVRLLIGRELIVIPNGAKTVDSDLEIIQKSVKVTFVLMPTLFSDGHQCQQKEIVSLA